MNKPVIRESCYYRKLTDRGKDDPVPTFNEALIENLTGELWWMLAEQLSKQLIKQSFKP